MSIISGQDSRLQIGLSRTWRLPTRTKQRIPFTQEGFKGSPNYQEVNANVGASAKTGYSIMSYKADGSFTTYCTPDVLKLLIYCALGYEHNPAPSAGQFAHKFEPVSSGECSNLPGLTVEIDRLLERGVYMNYKLNNWNLSAKAEDFVMFECDGPAFKEQIQTVLASWKIAAPTTPTALTGQCTVTAPTGVIADAGGNPNLLNRVVRVQDKVMCGQIAYFLITDIVADVITMVLLHQDSTSLPAAMLPAGARPLSPYWQSESIGDMQGLTLEILDFEMAPLVPLSTLENLRFVHGYLQMDDTFAGNRIIGGTKTGIATQVIHDCPVTIENGFLVEGRDLSGKPVVYKYIGANVTPVAGTVTFNDAPAAGQIKSIYIGTTLQEAFWEISEYLYDEVTDWKVSGNNNIPDYKGGANGSMYSSELNPSSREFNIDLTARFTKRLSELRKKRMMNGKPISLRLELETTIADGPEGFNVASSVDSNGHTYKVVIEAKKCFYLDGIPNISGADEPDVSPKLSACETPGVHKALIITVYDDVNQRVDALSDALATQWGIATREDAYLG
jgi:hypothetical protein